MINAAGCCCKTFDPFPAILVERVCNVQNFEFQNLVFVNGGALGVNPFNGVISTVSTCSTVCRPRNGISPRILKTQTFTWGMLLKHRFISCFRINNFGGRFFFKRHLHGLFETKCWQQCFFLWSNIPPHLCDFFFAARVSLHGLCYPVVVSMVGHLKSFMNAFPLLGR